MKLPLTIGLGSHHGDDQAGWLVVEQLQRRGYPASQLVRLRNPIDLLDAFDFESSQVRFDEESRPVDVPSVTQQKVSSPVAHQAHTYFVIFDACVGGGLPAGSIRRFEWPSDKLVYERPTGTHDQSLAEVMSIGQRFGCIPPAGEIWAIVAGGWSAGSEPSQEVVLAAYQVADAVMKEFQRA